MINPAAIYLSRREDWADLQTGEYTWVSEASFVPEDVTFKEVIEGDHGEMEEADCNGGVVTYKRLSGTACDKQEVHQEQKDRDGQGI